MNYLARIRNIEIAKEAKEDPRDSKEVVLSVRSRDGDDLTGRKVRVLEGDAFPIELCPASPTARPIYWESPDGTWHGPAIPEFLGRIGSQERFWIVTTYQGAIRWIRSDLLRNRQDFPSQTRPAPAPEPTSAKSKPVAMEQSSLEFSGGTPAGR